VRIKCLRNFRRVDEMVSLLLDHNCNILFPRLMEVVETVEKHKFHLIHHMEDSNSYHLCILEMVLMAEVSFLVVEGNITYELDYYIGSSNLRVKR
jgi:hypothetical protein